MSGDLDQYREALTAVAATCRSQLKAGGFDLPSVAVELGLVPAGEERVRTDYRRTVEVALSDPGQLAPPPDGANVIYGVCHEVGHLAVAAAVAPARLPPVVWDEAIAHYLALDLLLPAVTAEHGSELWPTPYPDYGEREVLAATTSGEEGPVHGYSALLHRQTGELRTMAAAGGGPFVLLAAVGDVAVTRPRPEDWRWKLRGRMLR